MKDKDMRDIYCDALLELAGKDDRLVVLDADLMGANGLTRFKNKYPDRFFNAGVAEANMVGMAAGLSAGGMTVFGSSFGCFASRRAFDQFFISSNYGKARVNLTGSDPGISALYNGGTHMAFEDIGLMRSIPGVIIYEPADIVSLSALVKKAAVAEQSTYLRLQRKGSNLLYDQSEQFQFGKGKVLRDGEDLTIIATGYLLVPEALKAADLLEKSNISAAVIDMHTIKPIDEELILKYAKKTGAVLTCENHQVSTGMGSAVSSFLGENYPISVYNHGVRERFGEVGSLDYLKECFGFNAGTIRELGVTLVRDKK